MGPGVPGVQRHRRHAVHAHRLVVDQPGRVARRARRCGRHARVQQLDGVARRLAVLRQAHRVPEVEARVLRGPDRLDPVRARAGRHGVGSARQLAALEGAHPRPAVVLLLRPHLRVLHRRPPRAALAARGRRGQHLLRDRLPAHRHDVAGQQGVRREDARRASTRRSRTRCCAATRSRCSSSTGSDPFGAGFGRFLFCMPVAVSGAEGPPFGHQGAEALRRRSVAVARRGRGARTGRGDAHGSGDDVGRHRRRGGENDARARGQLVATAARARRPDTDRCGREPLHAERQGVGPVAARRSRPRSGRRRSTRASPTSTRSSTTS